jgi:protein TonB
VKPDRLQLGFGVSLLIHAAAVGLPGDIGGAARNASIQGGDRTAALNLVAALEESAATLQPTIEKIAPAASSVPLVPVQDVQPESPIPTEPVKPVALVETPATRQIIQVAASAHIAATSAQDATVDVHGDDSSPITGLDAATKAALPAIKAEPDCLRNPEPIYPLLARRRHQQGLALLTAKITARGCAAEVALKTSSGFPLLDGAALQAVRDWQFEPARIGSLAVESEIEVPVRFELTN